MSIRTPEQSLWSWLRDRVKSVSYVDFERIENGVGRSTPDVAFSWCPVPGVIGGHGWIELKSLPRFPLGKIEPDTKVRVRHFTNGQRRWLRERGKKGGHCFLFLELGTRLFLFDHMAAQRVDSCTYEEMWEIAKRTWDKEEFSVEDFLEAITT